MTTGNDDTNAHENKSNVVYLKPDEIATMTGAALIAAALSMDGPVLESALLARADALLAWELKKQG